MTPKPDVLPFSYNWNNKLECKAFSTIRIYNPERHYVGKEFEIQLKTSSKTESRGLAKITAIKPFLLKELTSFMAYLDTGYSKQECEGVIRRMYPDINLDTKQLAFIVLLKNK